MSNTGTASQRLQVTGGAYVSGNLGVGVTNPTDKLHVLSGKIRVDSTTGVVNFWNGAGYYGGIGVAGGLGGSGTDIAIRADSTRSIIFFTGGANDRGRIDSSGTFLVGAASSTGTASQRLQVTGGAYVSGNLGIGNTNPTFPLTVNGNLYFEPNSNGYIRGNDGSQNGLNGSFLLIGTSGSSIDAGVHLRGGQSTTNDWSIYQKGSDNTLRIRADNATEPFVITNNGDVGINTTNPQYKLHVVGSFGATTKSFIIDHPTQEGKKLQYGSLEGPELGVYVRGRTQSSIIELPDYWTGLVDEETITVNLTPIGRKAPPHSVIDIVDNTVEIESANDVIDCFYTVFAERKDVPKLEVEF